MKIEGKCPRCDAQPGESCQTPRGKTRAPHVERVGPMRHYLVTLVNETGETIEQAVDKRDQLPAATDEAIRTGWHVVKIEEFDEPYMTPARRELSHRLMEALLPGVQRRHPGSIVNIVTDHRVPRRIAVHGVRP